MTQRFGKWPNIWEMAQIYGARHQYVANDLSILNMVSMCGKRLKYLRKGYTMLEMT